MDLLKQLVDIFLHLDKHLAEYNARRDGTFRLSVSVGLAVFDPARPVTVDELIREADARMYEQKQAKKAARGHV